MNNSAAQTGDARQMKTPQPGESTLVILLPADRRAEIDRWRKQHDPHHRVLPPHITVAYPPFVPEPEWPALRPVVATRLSRFRPFRITLRRLSTFDDDQHVLWLKPEDQGILVRIRDSLVDRLPQYVPELPQGYVPHLTLGSFSTSEELAKVAASIAPELCPLRFRVEELAYMVVDEGGVSRVRDRLALG